MNGYSLVFIPRSWHIGRWTIAQGPGDFPKKTLWAVGPFRFCIHRSIGRWKGY